jgi:cobaltochelatase CobN
MHILATASTGLEELDEPVDLGQSPGDVVLLSFSDSDLTGWARAWEQERDVLPSVRLASLAQLKHPMSVDLWVDKVARHARVIFVRILGGYDWWPYGLDQLRGVARAHGIHLAVVAGDGYDDPRLADASTVPHDVLADLEDYCAQGGVANLRNLLLRLGAMAGAIVDYAPPEEVDKVGYYQFDERTWMAGSSPAMTVGFRRQAGEGEAVLVVFYRSMYLANDTAPVDALCEALRQEGLEPIMLFVASLKDAYSLAFLEQAIREDRPAAIVTSTAFAASDAAVRMFAEWGIPVFQAVTAVTRLEGWKEAPRGLGASDLAMHIVLPELDGRVLAGAVSFKDALPPSDELGFTGYVNTPVPDRVAQVARRVRRWVDLGRGAVAGKGVAVLMPDYPGVGGRAGYAIGLDVPESVRVLLEDLKAAGYRVEDVPATARELMGELQGEKVVNAGLRQHDGDGFVGGEANNELLCNESCAGSRIKSGMTGGRLGSRIKSGHDGINRDVLLSNAVSGIHLADYKNHLSALPAAVQNILQDAWGNPEDDPDVREGVFRFRAARFGNITVALPPDRGKAQDRRADYHDPARPPRHALVAFGLWLQHGLKADSVVHMGAHGTLEWLPGKAVALSENCFPEAVMGDLPVIYPFLVSNPGEAAQAKRRLGAVTLGHLPPAQIRAGTAEPLQKLEQLVDEYAQADGMDRRRRDLLARLIIEEAQRTGLSVQAGIDDLSCANEALQRIDAWLCDLKEMSLKDGQHVYGRAACDDGERAQSARMERDCLLAALAGRYIPPGPAGSPARGRIDVLPTGRNMFTADPRTLPTSTAMDMAKLAADEVIRHYLQTNGDMPRSIMLNLWGSATLRTGGEEIAQALAYLGCRPQWDAATGRVTGVEVLPLAVLERPRVDVSLRLSGLFRDLFPAQIALLDAAVKAVALRDEDDADNPVAAAFRQGDERLARLFGSAAGVYGAGIEELLASGNYGSRADLGRAYLNASAYSYGGKEGVLLNADGAFEERVRATDLHVHVMDDMNRDLLEGSGDVSFIGGFASASALLGKQAQFTVLDSSRAQMPKARTLGHAIARIVQGRAINPRYIEGQMRHGPRGASDFAETVDRLIGFAETTDFVPSFLIDAVFDAYVRNQQVWDFITHENASAARALLTRFAQARQRGLWHPRRNDVDMWLCPES